MSKPEKVSASESLRLQLEELILNRKYLPEDRLPSEREIMRKFKVGRGTVREAYHSLERAGLLEIRHGEGAFVKEVDSSMVGATLATLIRHRQVSIFHLQEFREAIESRCAAYAAERATPDQISQLKCQVIELENILKNTNYSKLQFYEMELDLHIEMAKISGNPMFDWYAKTFKHNAENYSHIMSNQSEKGEEALDDWRDFISAVEKRQITRAAMIITSHILKFGKTLEELDLNQNTIK